MTGVPDQMVGTAMANAETRGARVIAGGVVINGAALVAVANMVANASDMDQALGVLLPAMWCFVIGASFAGGANYLTSRSGDDQVTLLVHQMMKERVLNAMIEPRLEAKQLAAAYAYDWFNDPLPSVETADQAQQCLLEAAKSFRKAAGDIGGRIVRRRTKTRVLTWLSATCLLLGFVVITGQHLAHQRLQPVEASAEHPSTAPKAAPPPTAAPVPARPSGMAPLPPRTPPTPATKSGPPGAVAPR